MPSGRIPDVEDYADPRLSAAQRLERLQRHNAIVRNVAGRLAAAGYTLFEDPYDTLATRVAKPSVLIEVKTLDGTMPDEIARIRGALAQLQYYERFAVKDEQKASGILKVAIFERPISSAHVHFLEGLDILPAWLGDDGSLRTAESSAPVLVQLGLS
jgi:hypothetical protein